MIALWFVIGLGAAALVAGLLLLLWERWIN